MLGLRCCGIRCGREREVRASWKAREDMSGIILHRDCLVDHSPRRMFAMLTNLAQQTESASLADDDQGCAEPSQIHPPTPDAKAGSSDIAESTTPEQNTVAVEVHDSEL